MKKKIIAAFVVLLLPAMSGCESQTFEYGECIGQFMTTICLTTD